MIALSIALVVISVVACSAYVYVRRLDARVYTAREALAGRIDALDDRIEALEADAAATKRELSRLQLSAAPPKTRMKLP